MNKYSFIIKSWPAEYIISSYRDVCNIQPAMDKSIVHWSTALHPLPPVLIISKSFYSCNLRNYPDQIRPNPTKIQQSPTESNQIRTNPNKSNQIQPNPTDEESKVDLTFESQIIYFRSQQS